MTVFGLFVFIAALAASDFFGWPSTQAVVIGAVVGLLLVVGDLGSELTRAQNSIIDLQDKLEQREIELEESEID